MQEISNSLRQRLRARPEPKVHPDPDLLTAYTEQALPPKERNQVVQHLAECSYCREIISLSLPEVQTVPVAVQAAGRSRWWIPAYRWAAVAATVAIAATLVVERPWKSHFERAVPNTTFSDNSRPASSEKAPVAAPAVAQSAANTPASTPAENTIQAGRTETSSTPTNANHKATGGAGAVAREEEGRRSNETVDVGASAGMVGGLRHGPTFRAPMAAPPQPPPPPQPVTVLQAQAAPVTQSSYVSKDVPQDYVNPVIVSNAAADVRSLPEAPPVKETDSNQNAARKDGPKINLQDTVTHQMNYPIAPPATAADQAPSATDSTLGKSAGFTPVLKSALNNAVHKTMATAKKMATAAGKSSGSSAPLGFAGTGFVASPAEVDQETAKRASREIHWRITPDGQLQRSSDIGQWHQVVTQNPNIQFKVVQPHGSEVWAGGNNGTLIHSWNAGVNWSQVSVPDSSTSDITAISIDDDDVQVKTSNGQAFVSHDHGKTWVPLQQQPQ